MNENTALGLLSRIMKWDTEKSKDEFDWLKLISAVKYDSYRDFVAGVRFLESLVGWLLQFSSGGSPSDREVAYEFVRNKVTFIGAPERERLVELIYPRTAMTRWLRNIADRRGIEPWQVHTIDDAKKELAVELRRTLFLGLSDGARLDSFRHVNVGRISNEQVVVGTQLDREKWRDLKNELASDLEELGSDAEPTFQTVCLVDDFAGSGTSFIRQETDAKGKLVWKGKLLRFLRSFGNSDACAREWDLVIHHLVMTRDAEKHLREMVPRFKADYVPPSDETPLLWFHRHDVTTSLQYEDEFKLLTGDAFDELTRRYYDERIETKATKKGGVDHLGRGYAGCALPLILDHNTPNNSVALLWAESRDDDLKVPGKYPDPPHRMRPLFRRRQRHIK